MTRLLGASILVAFLSAELMLAGGTPDVLALAWLGAGAWAVLTLGAGLRDSAGPASSQTFRLGEEFVLGLAAANLAVMGLINVAAISAGKAFAMLVAAVLVVRVVAALRSGRREAAQGAAPGRPHRGELFHLAVLCVVVVAWSRLQAGAYPALLQQGVAPVWTDYFLHANEIAQYMRVDGLARGSIILLGEPIELYHRAIFVIPAVFAQLTEISPLAAACAVLLPAGLLCCLAGVHVLGSILAGERAAGLLAAVLLVVLPDSASYGLRNGFFGFSWLLFTAPGTGWALGLCGTSLGLLCTSLRTGQRRVLGLATLLGLSAFWHRAHIFMHFVAAFVAMAFCGLAGRGRAGQRVGLAGTLKVLAPGLVLFGVVAWSIPGIREQWLAYSAVDEFLLVAHDVSVPTAYDGWYAQFLKTHGLAVAVPVGVGLSVCAVLGGLILVLPVLFWAKRRWLRLEAIDAFPAILLGIFVLFMLFGPSTYGRFTEYQHRGFPLLYAVILTYCVAYASRLAAYAVGRLGGRAEALRATVMGLTLALAPLTLRDVDPSKPRFAWGAEFHAAPVEQAVLRAGRFLAGSAAPTDVLAVVPTEPEATLNDVASELVAVSGLSAYLARAGLAQLHTDAVLPGFAIGRLQQVTEERLALLDSLSTLPTRADVERALAGRGVSWLITARPGLLPWDPQGEQAAFHDGAFAVYHIAGVGR